MAIANLYCTFVLLLYLQGNYAQQNVNNNQNVGTNNPIGLSQPPLRTNKPNNINQIPSGGLNINSPQSNLQQSNLLQPISANLQTNLQQSSSLPNNLQPQGPSVSLTNLQISKQGLSQLAPGIVGNPLASKSQISTQFNNQGCRQNTQIPQQQNMASVSNVPMTQTQNIPFSSNSLAEIAASKGQPSLLSLFANQNSVQSQQNQQMGPQNFNSAQNQLTDAQKQFLVRSLQSSQASGQNQPGLNFIQSQLRVPANPVSNNNQPVITLQSQQQSQPIVTTVGNPPPFITVQAQPLVTYLQNQSPQVLQNPSPQILQNQSPQVSLQTEDPSMLSLILSEMQPHETEFAMYPYQVQKRNSKSNLKSLIPLIIDLLKEKNACGCPNCGCPNNGCGNNNVQEPAIFSGYSNQKNYSQPMEEIPISNKELEIPKTKSNTKEQKNVKNVKKNTVKVDSEESYEENDSEYVDDSEGD